MFYHRFQVEYKLFQFVQRAIANSQQIMEGKQFQEYGVSQITTLVKET